MNRKRVIERVTVDRDRYHLSVVPNPKIDGGGLPALVRFGGQEQTLRDCVFMNTRT